MKFGLIDQLLNGLKFMVIMIRVPIGKKGSTLSLFPYSLGLRKSSYFFPLPPCFSRMMFMEMVSSYLDSFVLPLGSVCSFSWTVLKGKLITVPILVLVFLINSSNCTLFFLSL